MSTEKSILTYEEVKLPVLKQEQMTGELHLPIGVTPGGNVETVSLNYGMGTSHVCLFGLAGSGKSKALEFIIKAICDMYGKSCTISYIDGKDSDVRYWKKRGLPNAYMLSSCSSREELEECIDKLITHLNKKRKTTPDLIAFDDIWRIAQLADESLSIKMKWLLVLSAQHNAHILWVSQCGEYTYFMPGMRFDSYFSTTCATRVHDDQSVCLFGSDIASANGGQRKYGDMVYKYNGCVSRVRVPFCDYHM